LVKNLKGRDLEVLGVDGRMLLKYILRKLWGCGWINVAEDSHQ
jgi:hypothetical protein